jgi:transcriptional regulator with XRE-family HTH domain
MATRLQIKPGLLKRLRELREIPSEEHQARLMGVDRSTLRRIDAGATPSAAFMAALCDAFGLGLGEAFELVEEQPLMVEQHEREAVAA